MELSGRTLLGKYRIEKLLGQGGMGSVWRGTHALTGRKVAIKVLDQRFLTNLPVVQRFGREARAASAIQHDGIVEVLDLDQTEEGVPFLVMEFLEGESLADRIDRDGKMSEADVVRIGSMLLDALHAAHESGVVHRDLKPDNIYLVPSRKGGERVKILDFGISSKDDEAEQKLTMTGSVLGTPHYMSPEQARGDTVLDRRLDIYAVGIVLYECAVGEVPFDGANYNQLLRVILDQDPVPPRQRGARISQQVEALIMRALSKDRDRRPSTAAIFRDELALASGRAEVTSSPAPPQPAKQGEPNWGDASFDAVTPPPKSSPRVSVPKAARADTPPAGGGLDMFGDAEPSSGSLELDDFALKARAATRTSSAKLAAVKLGEPQLKLDPVRVETRNEPPPSKPEPAPSRGTSSSRSNDRGQRGPVASPPERSGMMTVYGIFGVLLLVGAGFGLRWLVRPGETTQVDAPTEVPVDDSLGADWVEIPIQGLPDGARVRQDGLPGARMPLRLRRGSHHTVEVSAGERTRRFVFDAVEGTTLDFETGTVQQ